MNFKILNGSNDFVNWLDELFDALEIGSDINLMGMSLGSWIASQYVLKFQKKTQ